MTQAREAPAAPRYAIDQRVCYLDHTNRLQNGHVLRVTAQWVTAGDRPHITYVVSHPTYRNGSIHLSEEDIKA